MTQKELGTGGKPDLICLKPNQYDVLQAVVEFYAP
jgi:hypothetical protein